jgi:hypothetical protein
VTAGVLKVLFMSLHFLVTLVSVYSYQVDILNYINLASIRPLCTQRAVLFWSIALHLILFSSLHFGSNMANVRMFTCKHTRTFVLSIVCSLHLKPIF